MIIEKETYIVARASGDQAYLTWLHERMQHVHKETPLVDYMHTLRAFKAYFVRRSLAPWWLNYLMRKYDL